MNRRQFLQFNALGLATLSSAYAMDHSHHKMMMHKNHMPSHTNNIDTSFISLEDINLPLLDSSSYPQNQALTPLPLLQNTSKEKNTFKATLNINETKINIIHKKKTRVFAYNNSIPAPKIEVYEGDFVEIKVKNNLKEPTTIHWHGLPIPPEQDGNPHDPILAGEERTYSFKLPLNSAGTYWYHPHPHYITGKQVYMGLAGVFVVKSKQDALSNLQEQDWVISDIKLDKNAQIPANNLIDWLNGREGNTILINGQHKPKITLDEAQRIRIYNFCSARYLNLKIQNAEFILVGTDGGLIETPISQKELFLSPASRVEVIIKPNNKGEFKLINTYYDRDKMMVKDDKNDIELATLDVKNIQKEIPNFLRKIEDFGAPNAVKEVIMSEDHSKMHGIGKKSNEEIKQALASMFLLNGEVFDMNKTNLSSKLGEVEVWKITNKSHMDHPFHIHGTQFMLLSSTFKGKKTKAPFKALQDTINVRPNETLELIMKQDFKGIRMYHCHILEHEDLGMMATLEVK
ncbi:multicopper oxidase family protein [Helicobacter burdigaliensis]|uniref:multicopper oxidase family protein n=1 Tax=Helicobacter burdigaliensis TaxID=2315334 RepID=UPI000EF730ED|nr:multicopper oxidase family protein [Helicobacter burdigaliensis]